MRILGHREGNTYWARSWGGGRDSGRQEGQGGITPGEMPDVDSGRQGGG